MRQKNNHVEQKICITDTKNGKLARQQVITNVWYNFT